MDVVLIKHEKAEQFDEIKFSIVKTTVDYGSRVYELSQPDYESKHLGLDGFWQVPQKLYKER